MKKIYLSQLGRWVSRSTRFDTHTLDDTVRLLDQFATGDTKEPRWPHCAHATREDLAWYAAHVLPVFGWSAQCRGFFADTSSPMNLSDADQVRAYHSAENFARLGRARQLVSSKGVLPVQIALAWVLHQAATTVALVGPSSEKRLQIALHALDIALTAEEIA